jgi:hypothetical protein
LGVYAPPQDGVVHWYEGAVSVGLYLLYVAFMTINERYMNLLDSWEKKHFPESHAAKLIRRDAKAESKNEVRRPCHRSQTLLPALETAIRPSVVVLASRCGRRLLHPQRERCCVLIQMYAVATLQPLPPRPPLPPLPPVPRVCQWARAGCGVAVQARQDRADKLEKAESKTDSAAETSATGAAAAGEGEKAEEEEEEEDSSPFSLPDDWKEYPLWALSLPWCALSSILSTDGRRGPELCRQNYAERSRGFRSEECAEGRAARTGDCFRKRM